MKYFEIEGKNAEDAVANFLSENNIPKDFITFETLEAEAKAFLASAERTRWSE